MAEETKNGALGISASINTDRNGATEFIKSINEMESEVKNLEKEIHSLEYIIQRSNQSLANYKSVNDTAGIQRQTEIIAAQNKELENKIQKLDGLKQAIAQATTATNSHNEALNDNTAATDKAAESAEKLAEAEKHHAESVQESVSGQKELTNAEGENAQQITELTEKLKELERVRDKYNISLARSQKAISHATARAERQEAKGDTENAKFTRSQIADEERVVKQLNQQLQSLNAEIGSIQQQISELSDTANESGEASEAKIVSLKSQLRQLQEEAVNLTVQYRSLSDEDKESEFGRDLAQRISDTVKKAGELKDAISDTQRALRNESSDTKVLDGLSQGVDTIVSSLGAAIGVSGMFASSQEELIEIQTKLQSVLTVSNALKTVQTNLQRESALMQGIEAIQTSAAATAINIKNAAEGKGIIVTKAATVAQAVFNAVAKMNPYVLLATAILSVIGVIAAYIVHSKEAAKADEEAAKAKQALIEKNKALKEIVGAAAHSVLGKFLQLQIQWKALRTEAEKTQWLKENKSGFNSMGLAINSVNDANKVFIEQADQVIDAMMRIALANEYSKRYAEEQVNATVNWERRQRSRATGDYYKAVKEGYRVLEHDIAEHGLTENQDFTKEWAGGQSGAVNYRLTEAGAKKINAVRNWEGFVDQMQAKTQTFALSNFLRKKAEETAKDSLEAKDLLKKMGISADGKRTGGGHSGGTNKKYKGPSVEDVQAGIDRQAVKEALRLELAKRQAVLDAQKETTAKRIEQIELDYDKQLFAIQEEEDKLKEAILSNQRDLYKAAHKGSKEGFTTTIDDIELSEAQKEYINALNSKAVIAHARALATIDEERAQSLRTYIKEYGSMEGQIAIISEEYATKIAKAKNDIEAQMLAKKRDEEIKVVKETAEMSAIAWENVFNDLSSHTKGYLISLRNQLQELIQSGKITDITDIEKLQEKINSLNTEISAKSGIFNFKGTKALEREQLEANVSNAQLDFSNAKDEVANATANIEKLQSEKASDDALRIAEDALTKARENAVRAADKVKAAEDAAKRSSAQAISDWFFDAQEFIAKKGIDQLPDLFNELGMGKVGEKLGAGLSGFNNAAGAAADFASGNYIGAAVKAIGAIKDFGSALGIGGNGNAKAVAELTEKNTEAIESLSLRIDKLKNAIDENSGVRAAELGQAAIDAQRNINAMSMETLRAQMGYHNSHRSNNYYADDSEIAKLYQDEIGYAIRMGANMQKSINGLNDIYNMSPEQIAAIKTYMPQLWKYLTTVGEYNKSEYWDAVAEQAEKVDELTEQVRDNLTNTTFDNLKGSFRDAILDMESTSADFAKTFDKQMYEAMVNAFVFDDTFDNWLKEWQDRYAKAVQNGDNAALRLLNTEAVNKRNELVSKRDTLANDLGYSQSSGEAQGTIHSSMSITEDTGNEIVGRMTAMQMGVEQMKVAVISLTEVGQGIGTDVASIKAIANEQSGYLSEIRDMQIESLDYLSGIQKNTNELYGMHRELTRIANKVDNL